jgi:2'-hydroxyisoflavone reductase
MTTTRRGFLKTSVATGAALAISTVPSLARVPARRRGAPLRLLILGGTGFLGPAFMEAARGRGHHVTLFNRGRLEARKHLELPSDVVVLYGNRDPNKTADEWKDEKSDTSPRGLTQLEGKGWDAVLDTSGYFPRIVKASAELLAPRVGQYVFISSVSAYKEGFAPQTDETAELATMNDPTAETMGDRFQNYGPLKALCEKAAEAALPGRTTIIRPGFIVGPGDPTDRFTYWPLRVREAAGERREVLCPGSESDPIQFIDVRDLAEWTIALVEHRTTGAFDALGPMNPPGAPAMTMGKLMAACRAAAGTDPRYTWVPAGFLEEQKLSAGGDLPIWVPPEGDSAGFHQRNVSRAVAAGLTFRAVEATVADLLAWWPGEVERRARATREALEEARAAGKTEPRLPDPARPRAGLSSETESRALAQWHTRNAEHSR